MQIVWRKLMPNECLDMLSSRMGRILDCHTLWKNSTQMFLGEASIMDVSFRGWEKRLLPCPSIVFSSVLWMLSWFIRCLKSSLWMFQIFHSFNHSEALTFHLTVSEWFCILLFTVIQCKTRTRNSHISAWRRWDC